MALFLVHHRHQDNGCPAKNPKMRSKLREHTTQASADKYEVKVLIDWIDEPRHRGILILEAASLEKATKFARPFGKIIVKQGSRRVARWLSRALRGEAKPLG